jgi:hypothetical protein
MPYVDLSRRFRDLTQAELEQPELLASLGSSLWGQRLSTGWPELLQCPRVILLAEAGSGKSAEMKEQVRRLRTEDKPAVFVDLVSLDRPLTELLSPVEKRILEKWRADNEETAWFFLDAVDELKLSEAKLDRALSWLANAIDGLLHRAHVLISCRPTDWRPTADMAIVQEKLPIPPAQSVEDDPFLAPLRERGGNSKKQGKKVLEPPRIVVLLPLSDQQIELLSFNLGVGDTAAFIAEIDRRDAWIFARRPLDIVELIASWQATGKLGTLAEQHGANIVVKLKDDPERRDRGVLSSEKARDGAERLALALALTHTRTIRSPEQAFNLEQSEGVLDPAKILPDWTEKEIQALLRRALFDPATYGRVRFHHRSVQEFLAARRLLMLREKRLSAKSLRRFMFAERYGEKLVIPSMQEIAAWLALWNDDTCRELMAREPETLLSMGDPESLQLGARAELLRAFAGKYGTGGWRGLSVPFDKVRRLACPDLGLVVRELWAAGPNSSDVRELLLEVIWHGSIVQCVNIAYEVAFDVAQDDHQRVIAVKAIVTCGARDIQDKLVRSILQEPGRWPDWVIHGVIVDLFPSLLSVTELITLVQRTPEPKSSGGFSLAMREIVESMEPSSDLAISLRDALAELIWQGRNSEQEWHHWRGRFDHVSQALTLLCDRQLGKGLPTASTRLIWSCVVANRFGADTIDAADVGLKLRRHFERQLVLRETAFWIELELMTEISPSEDTRERSFRTEHKSLLVRLTAVDRPWLLKALRSHEDPGRRLVALHALLPLWGSAGRRKRELDELRLACQAEPALTAILQEGSRPQKRNGHYESWRRKERKERDAVDKREALALEKWSEWKQQVCGDPEKAFGVEELPNTVCNICKWLGHRTSGSRCSVWDWDRVQKAFGAEIAARIVKGFCEFWRSNHPPERGNVNICEGLTGLAAEAMIPGWATQLTPAEARVAAAYATIEINAFPSWIPDLVAVHSKAVKEVIGEKLMTELVRVAEDLHLPVLQNLSYADSGLKNLLAPLILSKLLRWPTTGLNEDCTSQTEHSLDRMLGILGETMKGEESARIAILCEQQFTGNSRGPMALTWLRALFQFDPGRAVWVFEDNLASLPDKARSSYAVTSLARLFGDRSTSLDLSDGNKRAKLLGRLVRCSFRYVCPDEDLKHEGAYTPGTRDLAERARDSLLMALLDTPGAEARRIALDLARDPGFSHFPDRLRLLVRRRAAKDAETVPLLLEEVVALEKGIEAPPQDRDGLFSLMVDRFDDLAEELAHHDFSDRRTLLTIEDEEEMQRTLALRLQKAANGAYVVTREEEVADRKRTDIRLAATRGGQKAVIEVKIADKRWTLRQLEQALRFQLVGQYLRHDTCKAGCLLLAHVGKRTCWTHPKTKHRLTFYETIEYLRACACAIEEEQRFEMRLLVFPLDLTASTLQSVGQSDLASSDALSGHPRLDREV